MLTVVCHRLCVGHLYLKFGNERKEDRALQLYIKSVLGCYRRDVWMCLQVQLEIGDICLSHTAWYIQ